ncbi:MAG: beta-Ala-His dipeptidase [Planctomycetes bacterium]|nr:beta-Ala-His dipeptidase [Planctomycetota bacterium]
MSSTYDALQPSPLWKLFAEINRIPRPSGLEGPVMEMLEKRAKARGHGTKRDKVGNLLISVPATKGHEKSPTVVLQGHVDMVCEKNASSNHNFAKDPIIPHVSGEWVAAEGTTLGADNAIGVAMAIAAAEDPAVAHGPLEILLTVDEERGLTGAQHVEPGFFSGKILVNLDSEDDTTLTIGCAGMQESIIGLKGPRTALPAGWTVRDVFVTGLRGGHSGIDINTNRGNAIRILARALLAAADGCELRVVSIDGGNKRNAIAREARAVVAAPEGRIAAAEKAVRAEVARIKSDEVAGIDDGLEVRIAAAASKEAWSAPDTRRLLGLLGALPHGVVALSQTVEDLVESSTNLAVVTTKGDSVEICCTSRSSVNSSLDQMARQHRCIAELAGAGCEQGGRTPGWKPDPGSALLKVVKEQYQKTFGKAAEVRGIHAGLECGTLKERVSGLDAISFGPDIVGAHSPDERVKIESVARVYRLLGAVLGSIR